MFAWYSLKSAGEAKHAERNLAVALLRDRNKTFWTATMWTDDEAMKKFMIAGMHRRAMRKLPHWCDEAALVHWTQDNGNLPSWTEAWNRLEREGRRSKVNHPSPVHLAHKFPEPRLSSTSGKRLQ
jgi:hypothetical protein